MPPVKPTALPTLGSALARNTAKPAAQPSPQQAPFEPGLKAQQKHPRLSDITADAKPAPATVQKPAGTQVFTMQALSAYAGTIVGAAETPSADPGASDRPAKVRMPDEARPVRPGTNLDLKI